MKTLSVFNHTDYLDFLREWFAAQKQSNPAFSFQYFSKRAGFRSRSYMQFVLKGERALSLRSLPKVIQGLKLSKKEARYFEILVFFKESKDQTAKLRYWEQIQKLGKASPAVKLQGKKFDFFKQWYIAPLRELVCNIRFDADYSFLGKQLSPPISAAEAAAAVQLLTDLKLIKKSKKGYAPTHRHLKTQEMEQSVAIRKFQEATCDLAKEALSRHPRPMRDISTMTISTTRRGFGKIQSLLKELQENVIKVIESEEGADQVFHLNLQLFPLSKPMRDKL